MLTAWSVISIPLVDLISLLDELEGKVFPFYKCFGTFEVNHMMAIYKLSPYNVLFAIQILDIFDE